MLMYNNLSFILTSYCYLPPAHCLLSLVYCSRAALTVGYPLLLPAAHFLRLTAYCLLPPCTAICRLLTARCLLPSDRSFRQALSAKLSVSTCVNPRLISP